MSQTLANSAAQPVVSTDVNQSGGIYDARNILNKMVSYVRENISSNFELKYFLADEEYGPAEGDTNWLCIKFDDKHYQIDYDEDKDNYFAWRRNKHHIFAENMSLEDVTQLLAVDFYNHGVKNGVFKKELNLDFVETVNDLQIL